MDSAEEKVTCPACGGAGGGPFGPAGSAWDDEDYECPRCKGTGYVIVRPGLAKAQPGSAEEAAQKKTG